ncbi:MAG: hypothetical protein IMX01_09155 [Limnochordaceae bacterium]|nr:hypothetical protein [Limnochordaceae bacterium]
MRPWVRWKNIYPFKKAEGGNLIATPALGTFGQGEGTHPGRSGVAMSWANARVGMSRLRSHQMDSAGVVHLEEKGVLSSSG